jgi:hypothetical protein
MILLLLSLLLEPPTASQQAAAALALASAQAPAASWEAYALAHCQALKEDKPLVVFVRLPAYEIGGCVCCSMSDFPDSEGPCVVIGIPDGKGDFDRIATCYGPTNRARVQGFIGGNRRAAPPPPRVSPLFAPRFAAPGRMRGC